FVPLENWLESMYEQLDKTRDADFIKIIYRDLIKGNSQFAQNLRNKNFFDENVLFVEGENSHEQSRRERNMQYYSRLF
ncbi:MAG: hypothetical protein IIX86_10230, partial [Clostridia bacterium]|nr:hypothetical protein [Clostridia bacterium]